MLNIETLALNVTSFVGAIIIGSSNVYRFCNNFQLSVPNLRMVKCVLLGRLVGCMKNRRG